MAAKATLPDSAAEIAKLRAELEEMKEFARIRGKFGTTISDDQVRIFLDEERKIEAAHKKRLEDAEKSRLLYEARDKEIRAMAPALVESGTIRIRVNGRPVKSIGEDLGVPCPVCGAPLRGHVAGAIFALAEMVWQKRPLSELLIRSAKNPLGSLVGLPAITDHGHCPSCKEPISFISQLVVLE
jgi:hypothetical protein